MSFRPNRPPPAGVNPQYSSFSYPGGGFTPPAQADPPRRDTKHQPGVPGGNWGEESSADSLQLYSAKRPTMPAPVAPQSRVEPTQPRRAPEQPKPHLTVSAEPGAYERIIIDDLTQPCGARPRPPDRELTEFSNKCKFLSAEVVSRLLFEHLADPSRALKVLYLMERLAADFSNYQEIIRTNWALVDPLRGESLAHGKVVQSLSDLVLPRRPEPVYDSLISDAPAQPPQSRGLFGSLTVKSEPPANTQLPLNVFQTQSAPPLPSANTSAGQKEAVFHDILSL